VSFSSVPFAFTCLSFYSPDSLSQELCFGYVLHRKAFSLTWVLAYFHDQDWNNFAPSLNPGSRVQLQIGNFGNQFVDLAKQMPSRTEMPPVLADVRLATEVKKADKINPAGAAARPAHCLADEDSTHILISWAASLIQQRWHGLFLFVGWWFFVWLFFSINNGNSP